jgi:superfamily II RNA helicase
MGLSMLAKTVIFHYFEKFDGNENRMRTSEEFIQMHERAERRNENSFGTGV